MKFTFSYKSMLATTVVSSLFSLVVTLSLLVAVATRPAVLPLDVPEYQTLKRQFETEPKNTDLQAKLRTLDVRLRGDYFRHKTFVRRGAVLLLVGVAVTLLCWQRAFTIRRRLPVVKAIQTEIAGPSQNAWAQWAVSATALLVAFMIFVSSAVSPSVLSRDGIGQNEGDETSGTISTQSTVDQLSGAESSEASRDAPSPPTHPSPEQIAANWPRFRGPTGAGVSAYAAVPTTWDAASGENIAWKTAIDLPGVSSPIVWDEHVFVTGADSERRGVYCFDANSGAVRWTQPVESGAEDLSELETYESTGYAAPTPVTDGQHVYAMFATGDLACFDFSGGKIWQHHFGLLDNHYGHAISLVMHEDLLIVQLDQGTENDEKSKLLALRGATGETVWEVKRKVAASWATPVVAEYEGQHRIITCAFPWMIVYAADDGTELWRTECLPVDVGPSPVFMDGVVYVANDNAVVAAIRDGGEGDVSDTHVLWSAEFGLPDICSPLVSDRYVLLVSSYGTLACYEREQGGLEPLWEEDIENPVLSSPSLVGKLVYLIGDHGKGSVIQLEPTGYRRIASNDIGEPCLSSPAFGQGRIYIRGEKHLFCIAQS